MEGIGTMAAPARRRAFAEANRHTARVRLLKRGIVVVACLAVVALAVIVVVDPFRRVAEAGLSIDKVGVSGTKVTMANPKLNGFRQDSRPYQVIARTAVQDIRKPNQIELNELEATIDMGPNGTGRVTAATGFYDSTREVMDLRTNVRMRSEAGYELLASSAAIEFKTGKMVSDEPVKVMMRTGTIDADRMTVLDSGKQMIFEGRVKTLMLPQSAADETVDSLKGTAP